ncbi:hypothetical protein GCM10009069_30170 [Algimonas arctica]|uniref:Uncharacterized protein n=1 Tax=Algimonas arctica TaxID=1479486 RepID=A0A8J3CT80_9PROT|nr:hypothetical protein [Algimonas arctica]GHB05808.1 hypothetical protein GCM10009069_30170 [Algimonas arctica]
MSRNISQILQILSPTDGALKRLVHDIVKKSLVNSVTVSTAPAINLVINVTHLNSMPSTEPKVSLDEDENELVTEEITSWRNGIEAQKNLRLAFDGTTELSASIPKITFDTLVFERVESVPITNRNGALTYEPRPSAKVSEVIFNGATTKTESFEKLKALIAQHLSPSGNVSQLITNEGPFADLFTKLSSVSAGMADNLAKSQLLQQKRMDDLLEKQEELQRIRLEEIAAAAKLEQEELNKIKADLDAKEAELDNADARSTRRGIRGDITRNLVERQTHEIIPASARKLRWPILICGFLGLILSAGLGFWSFSQIVKLAPIVAKDGTITQIPMSSWVVGSLLLRGALGIIAATAIGLYMLSYLRSLEAEAGKRAHSLERYLFDIDRASWVIETVLEMGEEDNGLSNVPPAWLDGVTQNLFELDQSSRKDEGPVDALTQLMASGAVVKVGNGEASIECSPKASQKVARFQSKPE